tara:strand:- start:2205 stop:2540 length:336 start_codon:yes stop_codon:yes gene_type:complete
MLTKTKNLLNKLDDLQATQEKLTSELVKSLLIQEICPTAFDHGACKAFVAIKGTEETKTFNWYKLSKAKFPKDFSLVVTDGKGTRSVHDLQPFENLEELELLNPKRPKSKV